MNTHRLKKDKKKKLLGYGSLKFIHLFSVVVKLSHKMIIYIKHSLTADVLVFQNFW